jgi:protein gp37
MVGDASTTRFLSVEPQIEAVDLNQWLPRLDWIIQGGESGRGARPFDVQWSVDLIGECKKHGIPFFLKQLGSKPVRNNKPLTFEDDHAGNWGEWSCALRVRQMPAA